MHFQGQGDVLLNRQRVEQRAILEHHAQPLAQGRQLLFAESRRVLAEDFDAARSGLHQADNRLEQGALAAAATAEHDGDFPLIHVRVNPAQDGRLAVGHAEVLDVDGASHHLK